MNLQTILNLGILFTIFAGFSYIKSKLLKRNENNLEDFFVNRFGKVLYETFFENYTQKVWGLHPKQISKEWGEQRIKGISLSKAILNAIFKTKNQKEISFIEKFYYPKFGCGQLWDEMANYIKNNGGQIILNNKVVQIHKKEESYNEIESIEIEDKFGNRQILSGEYYISSMPIKTLINSFSEKPNNIETIAKELPYRDYILIGFYLDKFNLKNNTKIKSINNICPDNWIYLQDKNITAGRMQIMNNWSPYLVEDYENKVFISLEYFATENYNLWNCNNDELYNIAISDLLKLNICNQEDIIDKIVVKIKKAYPAYFGVYKEFNKIKDYLNNIKNLYCIGRNGQHKYNNMDHSMLSGIIAADILTNKLDKTTLWNVNIENSYLE